MAVDTGRLRVVPAEIAGEGQAEDLGFTSPGAYICEQRKRQGLSLDQLAVATKIPRPQLELLEEDRFGEMPGPVFVKGFLRCCARVLRLDEEAVLALLYEQERDQHRGRRREEPAAPDGPSASRLFGVLGGRVVTIAVLVLVVAVLVMIAFNLLLGAGGAAQS